MYSLSGADMHTWFHYSCGTPVMMICSQTGCWQEVLINISTYVTLLSHRLILCLQLLIYHWPYFPVLELHPVTTSYVKSSDPAGMSCIFQSCYGAERDLEGAPLHVGYNVPAIIIIIWPVHFMLVCCFCHAFHCELVVCDEYGVYRMDARVCLQRDFGLSSQSAHRDAPICAVTSWHWLAKCIWALPVDKWVSVQLWWRIKD